MLLNGFTQLVKSATRITMETSSLIDLTFVIRPTSFPTVCVVATSLSDHELVYCTWKINAEKYPLHTIKCRNYVNYDQTNLINDARVINWEPVYRSTDVNFAVNYSKNWNIFLTHAPLIQKCVKGKPCEWLDESIKRDMNRRDHLLCRARKNINEHSWTEYKKTVAFLTSNFVWHYNDKKQLWIEIRQPTLILYLQTYWRTVQVFWHHH